jgi:hypothetical protein
MEVIEYISSKTPGFSKVHGASTQKDCALHSHCCRFNIKNEEAYLKALF